MSFYCWFKGDAFQSLKSQMATADTNGRLEVRLDASDNMTLTVVPDGVHANTTINSSHKCPSDCP